MIPPVTYYHVDVFTLQPYAGNSLTVFLSQGGISERHMLPITQEMRHFESIFLHRLADHIYRARVFDLMRELDFAGHPLLGAGGMLHHMSQAATPQTWTFVLNAKTVTVTTEASGNGYRGLLKQGPPEFLGTLPPHRCADFAAALGLAPADFCPDYPPEVISTGLRYLVVPIRDGIARAGIVDAAFAAMLETVGAEFVYLLDISAAAEGAFEARHWNNDGVVEDVATGSGAGTACAYLVRHGLAAPNQDFILRQGRFTGRPSEIALHAVGTAECITDILVGGELAIVGMGSLLALPPGH